MLPLSLITTVVNPRPRTSSGPGLEFFSNILAIYRDSPSLHAAISDEVCLLEGLSPCELEKRMHTVFSSVRESIVSVM